MKAPPIAELPKVVYRDGLLDVYGVMLFHPTGLKQSVALIACGDESSSPTTRYVPASCSLEA